MYEVQRKNSVAYPKERQKEIKEETKKIRTEVRHESR